MRAIDNSEHLMHDTEYGNDEHQEVNLYHGYTQRGGRRQRRKNNRGNKKHKKRKGGKFWRGLKKITQKITKRLIPLAAFVPGGQFAVAAEEVANQ